MESVAEALPLAWLFRLADQVTAPSTGTKELMLSLRIPDERIALTPYVVDNQWWITQVRHRESADGPPGWQVPANAMSCCFARSFSLGRGPWTCCMHSRK